MTVHIKANNKEISISNIVSPPKNDAELISLFEEILECLKSKTIEDKDLF